MGQDLFITAFLPAFPCGQFMDVPVSHFAQFIYQFLLFLDFLLVKDGRQFLEAVFRIPVQLTNVSIFNQAKRNLLFKRSFQNILILYILLMRHKL